MKRDFKFNKLKEMRNKMCQITDDDEVFVINNSKSRLICQLFPAYLLQYRTNIDIFVVGISYSRCLCLRKEIVIFV